MHKISKTNLVRFTHHQLTGFNKTKDQLNEDFQGIKTDTLTVHDIDRLKVSLKNMREAIESVEAYLTYKH